MTNNLNKRHYLFWTAVIIVTCLVGMVIPPFVYSFSDKYFVLLAVPLAICLGIFLLLNPINAFLVILLFRSSLDVFLEKTKFGPMGLGAIVNLIVILIALNQFFRNKDKLPTIFIKSYVFFLLTLCCSIIYSPDKFMAIKTLVALLSYASVFYLGLNIVKSYEDLNKWLRVVLFSSFVPLAFSVVNILNGGFVSGNSEFEGFRVNSTFSHPNVLAFYTVTIITLSFLAFKSTTSLSITNLNKLNLSLLMSLLLCLLALTKTRSAWAALVFFILSYGLIFERRYLIYLILIFCVALFIPEIRDRILDLGKGNEVINYSRLNSFAWRKLIWSDGLRWMDPSRYAFGYGTDGFRYYSPQFFSMSGGVNFGAHNVFVQLIFDMGLVGLAAYLWIFAALIFYGFKNFYANKLYFFTFSFLIIEYLLESYSDNMLAYLAFNWYFWFVIGALYSYGKFTYERRH